jgi:hypothetical protein
VKLTLAIILLLGWASTANASGPFEARPAGGQETQITWATPTNNWPERLWVYKVIPQDFSAAVLSNILNVASFTEKDRAKPPSYVREADRRAIYFSNRDETKHLSICPSLGWIDYADEKAVSPSQLQPVAGVPDQAETTRLGLMYLRLVGVDVSQIAAKPGTCELDLHWERRTIGYVDQRTKQEVTLTNKFTVFFRRRIDGIYVGGIGLHGGVIVGFGNNAKLAELQVRWRNLRPYELHDCVKPDQIVKWLSAGQIPLPPQAGPPAQVKKITVNQALPYYDSKFGDEPEDFVSPKVDLIAVVDGGLGTKTVIITCPILSPGPVGL